MPSKKQKYNARFPAGRIKKIMQSDDEIGKVAQAVPVIISRTLELFMESLLTKTLKITNSRNAKTLSPSHMKQCIMAEQRFDFLRELVKNIPDISVAEEAANYTEDEQRSSSPEEAIACDSDTPFDLSMPSTSTNASTLMNGAGGGALNNHHHNLRRGKQNGGAEESRRMYLKREYTHRQRLQHMEAKTEAGLMRAMSATSSCEPHPPKLLRADSSPAASFAGMAAQPSWPPGNKQRPKANNSNNNCSKILQLQQQLIESLHQQSQQQQKEQQHTPPKSQTAIVPAPIVSYDFCNKPVVKINYSHIPSMTSGAAAAKAAAGVPLSAPPMGNASSAFDFNAAPVISIDLSNINIAPAHPTNSDAPPAQPTATRTSIPSLSSTSRSLSLTSASLASKTSPATANSKASSNAAPLLPFEKNATPTGVAIVATSALPAASSESPFFELDEDYDNI